MQHPKRDTKEIMKMIEMQKQSNNTTHQEPDISYEEACTNYRYYKSRTLKANVEESDFKQNMAFREFYLNIKKRYDMQKRAHRFRVKQKQEIAKLKLSAQGAQECKEEVPTTCLGKRSADSQKLEELEEMQRKIQRLEQELNEKDQMFKELKEQQSSGNAQSFKQQVTKPNKVELNVVDQTISEQSEEDKQSNNECDSVNVSSNLKFKDCILQMKKEKSLTPVHQANKSFEQKDKQFVIEIDEIDENEQSASSNTQKEEEKSIQSSSVHKAEEFVKTPKMQSLIQQMVMLKSKNNQQQKLPMKNKITQKQIESKQEALAIDQATLSTRIKDMIDASMIFAQLKQQPSKLQWRKNELIQQQKDIQQQIQILDENYSMTMRYIESEENTQKMNQEQIQKLDVRIKKNMSQLRAMKQAFQNQKSSA